MNVKKLSLIYCAALVFTGFQTLASSHPTPSKPTPDQTALQQANTALFSFFPDTSTYKVLQPLQDAITLIFKTTLGLQDDQLILITKFYAYLQQQAVEASLKATPCPSSINVPSSPITAPSQTQTSLSLFDAVEQTKQAYAIAKSHNDTAEIKRLDGVLTQLSSKVSDTLKGLQSSIIEKCRLTKSWQDHLKVFIANTFPYEIQLLGAITNDETQMFSFLPQFEVAYYSVPYANLRTNSEFVRVYLVLTDLLRERAIAQCPEWSPITKKAELYEAIEAFKEGDFYQLSQQFDLLSNSSTLTPLTHLQLSSSSNTVLKGYQQYFGYSKNKSGAYVLTPLDPAGNLVKVVDGKPYLTALGNFLLQETATPALIKTANFTKLFTETATGNIPTELFIELISFSAIRLLSANTAYLFNSANLNQTMQKLNTLEQSTTPFNLSLFPNINLYTSEDQLFLEDINDLSAIITAASQKGASPANFWDDIGDAFKSAGNAIADAFTSAGNAIVDAAKKVGDFVVDASEAVGYGIAGVALQIGGQADDAGKFFGKANDAVQKAGDDVTSIVNDIASVGLSIVSGVTTAVVQIGSGWIDKSYANNVGNFFEKAEETVINLIRDEANFAVGVGTSLVKLTFEAVELIAAVVVGGLETVVTGGKVNAADELLTLGQDFVKDLIKSILNAASLFVSFFTNALKSLMSAIAYLTAALTDLVIDISAGLAAIVDTIAHGGNIGDNFNSLKENIAQHQRLISGLVGAVIMVAITVGTLGTGSALAVGIGVTMAVIGVGMSVMQVIGANQQDETAIAQKSEQHDFVNTFSKYVQATIPAQQSIQQKSLAEISLKVQESSINSERGLVYYQNYMNATINAQRSAQDYQISSFYRQQTTPDTNYTPAIMKGDVGHAYGLQTGRLDLDPAKGLRLYSSTRNTFAQEIATQPKTYYSPDLSSSLESFITQKDLATFTSAPLSVKIRWRTIYESSPSFYIGIYINQNYIDTGFLNALHANFEKVSATKASQQEFQAAWQPLETFNSYLYNFDKLSKSFICYRNEATQYAPALGIYEYQGAKEFISTTQQPSGFPSGWYQRGTWYVMQAAYNPSGAIAVEFYAENNPTVKWSSSVNVTPLSADKLIPYTSLMKQINYTPTATYAGSFGVIISGASVEYEIINPAQTITPSTQALAIDANKKALLGDLEINLEKAALQSMETQATATFGSWTLTAVSKLFLAQNIYLYTTTGTNLANGMKDYVVAATNPPTTGSNAFGTISLVGSSVTLGGIIKNTPYLISLVTGDCYDTNQKSIRKYPDALAAYQTTNTLPEEIKTAIQTAQQSIVPKISGSFSFQNVTFVVDAPAVAKQEYIYTCTGFIQYVTGNDYFVFSNLDNKEGIYTFGAPQNLSDQNNTINAAVSLVTGKTFKLYDGKGNQINSLISDQSSWKTIRISEFPALSEENLFEKYNSDPTLIKSIQTQRDLYTKTKKAAADKAAADKAKQDAIKKAADEAAKKAQQTTPTTDPVPSQSGSMDDQLSGYP